jgi:flagellar basal body-associated protein FliL
MGKVVVPFLVLTALAAIAALVMTARDGAASTSAMNLDQAKLPDNPAEVEPGVEAAIPLAVVTRATTENGDRYVKMNFELRLKDAKDRDEVMRRMPMIRDALIYQFLDASLADLTGSANLERVKRDVLRRLQKIIPQPLHSIYITEFVVAM